MSATHGHNAINEITREEHDPDLNAKRVNVISGTITANSQVTVTLNSTPTLFAVVNTSAAGQASIVLDNSVSNIGFSTVAVGSAATIFAVVNTTASSGLATIDIRNTINANVSLSNSLSNIGFATVNQVNQPALVAGAAYIGLATVDIGTNNSIAVTGNVTLTDSKTFIGLTTSVIGSAATLFAVVNTSVAGQASVVLDAGSSFIGITTVANKDRTVTGNVTLSDAKDFIGLTTTTLGASPAFIGITTVANTVTVSSTNLDIRDLTSVSDSVAAAQSGSWNVGLNAGAAYIGLTTSVIGSAATLFAVVNTSAAGQASVVLDTSVAKIGFATVAVASSATIFAVVNTGSSGNVTLDDGSLTGIVGNVTLSDSKGFIGLTTTVIGSGATLFAVVNTQAAGQASVVLDASIAKIGFATVNVAAGSAYMGLASVNIGGTLPALSAGAAYIGLATVNIGSSNTVTLGAGAAFAGIVTVTNRDRTITGNLTLSDAKTFIGLTTSVIGSSATLFAVVNTQAAGQASVVLDASIAKIGFATVNVAAGAAYMGLASVNIGGTLPALTAGAAFIGLTTTTLGASTAGIGFSTVAVGSAATLFAVVNTAAAGQASVVLDTGSSFIGIVTVTNKDRTITGNVTLSDSKTYIGLVTATIGSSPSVQMFGQYMPTMPSIASGELGPVALDLNGRVITSIFTIADSKGYLGLVSVSGTVGITGNVTLSDSKTFIGLTTSVIGSSATLFAVVNTSAAGQASVVLDNSIANIGFATVSIGGGNVGVTGNVTLSDSKGFIGLVTIGGPKIVHDNLTAWAENSPGLLVAGMDTDNEGVHRALQILAAGGGAKITGDRLHDASDVGYPIKIGGKAVSTATVPAAVADNDRTNAWFDLNGRQMVNLAAAGNVTLSDPKTYIGLTTTTLGAGIAGIGFATVANAAGVAYIGLVTAVPAFKSVTTIHTQIVSATGNTTIFVAPASNRFFIKNLHVSSLGRAEIEIRSGATTLIPFTGLATTSGFSMNYGEEGLPSRAQADGFVVNLNGGATIGVMINWYAAP